MKKNNTAHKTALKATELSKALKESTEKSIRSIINETITNLVKESEDDDLDVDNEGEYDVEDVETEETPKEEVSSENEMPEDETEKDGEEGGESAGEKASEQEDDEDFSDMEDYKVGDNEYDFTDAEDDEVLKVYNMLGDDDKIFVKKNEDGSYMLKDQETGAEYVIELDADALENDADGMDGEEEGNEFEFELGGDEEGNDFEAEDGEGDETFDFDIESDNDEEGEDAGEDGDDDIDIEISNSDEEDPYDDKLSDEEDEALNEDTINDYQKDVMPGLKMNEPADKKATYSMDGGVPTGTTRPYGKRGSDMPFEKPINEGGIGHKGNVVKRTTAKTNEKDYGDVRNNSVVNAQYVAGKDHLEECVRNIVAKAKQIQEENKQYKKYINTIKKSLCEAAVLNITLGQIVKLLKENTTTKEEKESIVERFTAVKTINEGKALYDTISRELNENRTKTLTMENQISADKNRMLNETSIYRNRESNPSLDLMRRMDNLYK